MNAVVNSPGKTARLEELAKIIQLLQKEEFCRETQASRERGRFLPGLKLNHKVRNLFSAKPLLTTPLFEPINPDDLGRHL